MKYIFSLIFLTQFLTSPAQSTLDYLTTSNFITTQNSERVIISENQVTNRDYLVYLMWLMNVSATDYPETFISALPLLDSKDNYYFEEEFYNSTDKIKYICDNSSYINKDYLFNTKYIDYPVLGLNWLQASKFLKWAADRYNEFLLIQKGHYNLNGYQMNEDCFVTESYLTRQYEGSGKMTNTFIKWSDNILIANFRLPTKNELDLALKNSNTINSLTLNKKTNKYLNPWVKKYFDFDNSDKHPTHSLNFKDSFYVLTLYRPSKAIDLNKITYQELTLDLDSNLNYIDAFSAQGYNVKDKKEFQDEEGFFREKDSVGQMQFLIIDSDKDNQTILLEKFKRNESYLSDSSLYTFRYAINAK